MADNPSPKSSLKSRGLRLLFSVLRIFLVLLIMLAWFQRSLIYHPRKAPSLPAKESGVLHATVDVTVPSFDNTVLHGWLTLARSSQSDEAPNVDAELKAGRPLVILFPGNAGNRLNRAHLLETMASLGADAMIFDSRGYGDNAGSPTEANFAKDAQTIWKYATETLHVPANRIILYGESLGGATASRLAGDLGTNGVEPGGLILQSTFNSLVDAGRYHFPYLPVSLILIDRFESQKHVVNAKCPVLQIHGERDEIVPLRLGKKLFEAVPAKSAGGIPKQQILLPSADHNDVYLTGGPALAKSLREFLAGVQKRAQK